MMMVYHFRIGTWYITGINILYIDMYSWYREGLIDIYNNVFSFDVNVSKQFTFDISAARLSPVLKKISPQCSHCWFQKLYLFHPFTHLELQTVHVNM